MKDYQQLITIATNVNEVFNALTLSVPDWWGPVDRPHSKLGDRFKVSFGEAFWTFEIKALKPNQTITWLCVESNQVHAGLKGVKEEWLGTLIHWNLEKLETGETMVRFQHEGLVPDFNCYDVCATAWDFFITNSLKSYLEKGQGQPYN